MTKAPFSTAGAAATVAAVLVVIAGLLTLGMPSSARERRLDGLRVDDLSQLSRSIDLYWGKHAALPPTLDSLVAARQLDRVPLDPQNNTAYTYLVSGERSYRLCATFAQPSDTSADANQGNRFEVFAGNSHSWRHGAGESCFDLTPPAKDAK
jgi:hypothetical protein